MSVVYTLCSQLMPYYSTLRAEFSYAPRLVRDLYLSNCNMISLKKPASVCFPGLSYHFQFQSFRLIVNWKSCLIKFLSKLLFYQNYFKIKLKTIFFSSFFLTWGKMTTNMRRANIKHAAEVRKLYFCYLQKLFLHFKKTISSSKSSLSAVHTDLTWAACA